MRRRTPSEIKAYGDGYAEAYKQFCHLLKKNDKDKAIRKMEIFAKGVEITVETAMDEPNCSEKPNNCEPQMAEDIVRSFGFNVESYRQAKAKTEPQTDCAWK